MTFHARLSTGVLTAAIVAAGVLPAGAADPSPHPVPRACQEALNYEMKAATDSISPQAAYDASIAGLEANKGCRDEPMRLTREAYLLSMRAAAEHALNVGNWQRDLARAQMLLANCASRPDVGRAVAENCRRQSRYNEEWTKRTLAQPTTSPATPRPSYAPATATPAGSAPRPVIGPAQTPPPPPRPSPRP